MKSFDEAADEQRTLELAHAAEHTDEVPEHHTIDKKHSLTQRAHHHHHHHLGYTYPAGDSHSKVVPYVVRDHAWNHAG